MGEEKHSLEKCIDYVNTQAKYLLHGLNYGMASTEESIKHMQQQEREQKQEQKQNTFPRVVVALHGDDTCGKSTFAKALEYELNLKQRGLASTVSISLIITDEAALFLKTPGVRIRSKMSLYRKFLEWYAYEYAILTHGAAESAWIQRALQAWKDNTNLSKILIIDRLKRHKELAYLYELEKEYGGTVISVGVFHEDITGSQVAPAEPFCNITAKKVNLLLQAGNIADVIFNDHISNKNEQK